jgi:hypothetical protein
MTPNPPIWIRTMITTLPNPLQYTGVSTVTSPVTHTEEVDVNSASRKGAPSGPLREMGSISSAVPTATATANPSTITWAGCCGAKTLRMRGKTLEPPGHSPLKLRCVPAAGGAFGAGTSRIRVTLPPRCSLWPV